MSAGEHGLLPNRCSQGVWGFGLDELLGVGPHNSARDQRASFPPSQSSGQCWLHADSVLNPRGCWGPSLQASASCPGPPALSVLAPSKLSWDPARAHHQVCHQLCFLREVEGAGLRAVADGLGGHVQALDEAQLQGRVLARHRAAEGRWRLPPVQLCPEGRPLPLGHGAQPRMDSCQQQQRPGHMPSLPSASCQPVIQLSLKPQDREGVCEGPLRHPALSAWTRPGGHHSPGQTLLCG